MVKASILKGIQELETFDYPQPEVGDEGILLDVKLCGVCGTDIHIYDGKMDIPHPIIPGHEFIGEINEMGEEAEGLEVTGRTLSIGDLVTVVPGTNAFCGTCHACRFTPQKPTLCTNRRVMGVNMTSEKPPHLNGGWAEQVYVDAGHWWVYKIPEEIPAEVAVLTEPMAVSSRALERAYIPGVPTSGEGYGVGSSVVIQGVGPIGLLALAATRITGAGEIIAIDMVESRLDMAEKLGADHVIDMNEFPTQEERVEKVKNLTNGLGGDVVIECAGVPQAFAEGIRMTRRGGKYVEVGHYTDPGDVRVNPHTICMKDMDILGSWAYPPTQFKTALEIFKRCEETIPLEELVTGRYGISEAEEAIRDVKAGRGIKMVVDP